MVAARRVENPGEEPLVEKLAAQLVGRPAVSRRLGLDSLGDRLTEVFRPSGTGEGDWSFCRWLGGLDLAHDHLLGPSVTAVDERCDAARRPRCALQLSVLS